MSKSIEVGGNFISLENVLYISNIIVEYRPGNLSPYFKISYRSDNKIVRLCNKSVNIDEDLIDLGGVILVFSDIKIELLREKILSIITL